MSLTVDRLLDERPEVVYLKRIVEDNVDDNEYEMDVAFHKVAPDKADGHPGTLFLVNGINYVRITVACSPWGAEVIKEDNEGRLLIEIIYDTETEGSEGTRDLVMVRGFTPGYNDPA